MSVEVINFGCRLNLAEGEAIRDRMAGQANIVVINSCAVTQEAERQARQAIRQAARRRPDARIIVTGCAAETSAATFGAMPEVSEVVGNLAKRGANAGPAVSGADHARAFVEVQNGCDHDCTFCIIPQGRGRSRSIAAGAVIDAIRTAVDRGQQEVILTGVDLTSYGPDLPGRQTLGGLVERILKYVPDLPRLRLSSLDSIEIDPRLEEIIAHEPRVMPHVHLSLQSGDDLILKRMKRRHSRAESVALVERLKAKRPEIAIGADIIAGFPTETDAMFQNSLQLLEDCDIVFGHIFPFSPRPGTAAARMPLVARPIIKERAEQLRSAAGARKARWLATLVGTRQNVLVELDGRTGHAPNFARVSLDQMMASGNMRGTMIETLITASDGKTLAGIPA